MPWSQWKVSWIFVATILLSCGTKRELPTGWKTYQHQQLMWNGPAGFLLELSSSDHALLTNDTDTIEIFTHPDTNYPLPLKEAFQKEFFAVHYNKFADQVYMDPKVKAIFKDSVQIVEVMPLSRSTSKIRPCNNCNVLAKIKFKQKIFDFPVQMSEKKLSDDRCHLFRNESSENYAKKIFLSKNDCGRTGAWIASKNDSYLIIIRGKNKNTESLLLSVRM